MKCCLVLLGNWLFLNPSVNCLGCDCEGRMVFMPGRLWILSCRSVIVLAGMVSPALLGVMLCGGLVVWSALRAFFMPMFVRLCFACLCGGVGTVVGGNCCEAGVVGSGCAGVVLVGCAGGGGIGGGSG